MAAQRRSVTTITSEGKHYGAIGSVLTTVAVLIVVYFAYQLLFARRAQAATAPGIVGGGYSGYSPYSTGQQYYGTTQNPSLLQQLLNALKGGQSSSKGSGGGSGSGGGGSTAGNLSGGSLAGRQQLQTLADFVNAANYDYYQNGGVDSAFASSDPFALFNPSIPVPDYTPQTIDVSQFAQPFNPFPTGDLTDAFASSDVFGQFAPQIPTYDLQSIDLGTGADFGGGDLYADGF